VPFCARYPELPEQNAVAFFWSNAFLLLSLGGRVIPSSIRHQCIETQEFNAEILIITVKRQKEKSKETVG
jgi:hypothetical protein